MQHGLTCSGCVYADLLEKHLALQERKVWVDSLGACHLRLRGTTFEALPDAAEAKGEGLCCACRHDVAETSLNPLCVRAQSSRCRW